MGFLQHHGFHVMMTGFTIIAVCALYFCFLIMTHHLTLGLKNGIFLCAFSGLIIYAAGRVLVFLETRRQKTESKSSSSKDPV
jgi:preprotein translocase subunit SecF